MHLEGHFDASLKVLMMGSFFQILPLFYTWLVHFIAHVPLEIALSLENTKSPPNEENNRNRYAL